MKFQSFAFLIVGAAVGSVATYYILRNRIETEASQRLEASIRDMDEYYRQKYANKPEPEEKSYEDIPQDDDPETEDDREPIAYNSIVSYKPAEKEAPMNKEDTRSPLIAESDRSDAEEQSKMKPPYTITPDAYGNDRTHEKRSLIYYSTNQVLVEEDVDEDVDPVVRDVDILIGTKNLKRFGEFEEGMVYVRNDNIKVDYSIRRRKGRYMGPESLLDD